MGVARVGVRGSGCVVSSVGCRVWHGRGQAREQYLSKEMAPSNRARQLVRLNRIEQSGGFKTHVFAAANTWVSKHEHVGFEARQAVILFAKSSTAKQATPPPTCIVFDRFTNSQPHPNMHQGFSKYRQSLGTHTACQTSPESSLL